jgi:hypothetical protein
MMKSQRTLLPGEPGAKSMTNKYGDRLICVRYRFDPTTLKKFKTVELIEEEIPWEKHAQRIPVNKILNIRVHVKELRLRQVVKAAGGRWNPEKRTWQLPYRMIRNLGLEDRILFEKD